MSEETKVRSRDDINQEYINKCTALGNLVYQNWITEQGKSALLEEMKGLNLEAADLLPVKAPEEVLNDSSN